MTTGKTMEIDIGNLCTHCGKDTLELASSGMRIASGADAKLTLSDAEIDIVVNGWMCVECREMECDRCGKMSYEYEILDKPTPEVVCQHCMEEGGRMTTGKGGGNV